MLVLVGVISISSFAQDTKEAPDLNNYGSQFGLGISVGGSGGLVGLPIRYYFNQKVAIELGLLLRPGVVAQTVYDAWGNVESTRYDFTLDLMTTIGMDFFPGYTYRAYDSKLIKNGLFIRLGTTPFALSAQNMFALGWARERFKAGHPKNSYLFSLGIAIFWSDSPFVFEDLDIEIPVLPALYWKFHWNWFVGKTKTKTNSP